MKINRFEDLQCWQEARKLTQMVYAATNNRRFSQDYRLTSKIRASAASAMGNCAKGFVRRSNKEFTQYLCIAMSSAAEVKSHLCVALDQNYIDSLLFKQTYHQADKTGRVISGMIHYLRTTSSNPTKQARQTK